MGAVNSCWVPRHEFNENHVSTPKKKGHRKNLSATFNLTLLSEEEDNESLSNLININSATEEELMTLPGINRNTAQNIVEYRRRIFGFKKVEDLALVSGVGATKLNNIRSEITVSHKKTASSRASSLEGSHQDVTPSERETRRRGSGNGARLVNVNTANVFQLMKVKGLGQAIAENIVSYRDKNGLFKSLDDLIKVKRIGPALLGAIRYQLTLTDSSDSSSTSSGASPYHANGDLPYRMKVHSVSEAGDANANCLQSDLSVDKEGLNLSASQNDLFDVLGPLVVRPSRPSVLPYTYSHDGRPTIKIASWNLEQCSVEKANNPGVRDVVCLTVLETGFSIVAVQGLADRDALDRICDELNYPVLPNVKRWTGHRGLWDSVTSERVGGTAEDPEYCGFLYDKSLKISLVQSGLLHGKENGKQTSLKKPFVAVFKVGQVGYALINLPDNIFVKDVEETERRDEDRVSEVIQLVDGHYPDEAGIFILGDWSRSHAGKGLEALKDKGYVNCLPVDEWKSVRSEDTGGLKYHDNIWTGRDASNITTGNCGVTREGLVSPWIPNGWKWGGVVSEHCPVWTEIHAEKDLTVPKFTLGD